MFLINFLLPLIMESGRVNEVQQDLTAPGIQNLGGSGQVSGIDYNPLLEVRGEYQKHGTQQVNS